MVRKNNRYAHDVWSRKELTLPPHSPFQNEQHTEHCFSRFLELFLISCLVVSRLVSTAASMSHQVGFQDDEDEEDENYEPNPADYEHFFHVRAGGDTVYIEDPLQENEAGWTPLHACCMSLQTVEAGLELIEEMARRGGHFDTKTVSGPGTFNRGWTALQM